MPIEDSLRAHCPRCGYDLRGAVATWDNACPLAGICAECGLDFDWAELLNPELRKPRWCIEYGRGRPDFLRRAVAAILVSFAPMRFWRDLKMTHEIRWRRIALYFVLLLTALYLIFAGSQGWSAWTRYEHARSYVVERNSRLSNAQSGPWRIVMPPAWQVVGRAILLPLSAKAPEYIQAPAVQRSDWSWRFDLRSPLQLIQVRTSGFFGSQGLIAYGKAALFPFLLNAGIAMGFVLLPVTRRIARVRWRHIARITVYAVLFCLIPIGFMCFGEGEEWAVGQRLPPNYVGILCFIAAPLVLVIWWGFATSRHLRLNHGWAVVLALGLIAFMILLLFGYYTFMIWHWQDLFL